VNLIIKVAITRRIPKYIRLTNTKTLLDKIEFLFYNSNGIILQVINYWENIIKIRGLLYHDRKY